MYPKRYQVNTAAIIIPTKISGMRFFFLKRSNSIVAGWQLWRVPAGRTGRK
jgi:hypothetical protein